MSDLVADVEARMSLGRGEVGGAAEAREVAGRGAAQERLGVVDVDVRMSGAVSISQHVQPVVDRRDAPDRLAARQRRQHH